MADTTILFATHRATTAQRADKIVVIEDGRISEEGTHWDLMAGKGLYSRIYQRQMIARDIENGF
jgi:ABC-type multidrug transport system fused ATPase/permease subunit